MLRGRYEASAMHFHTGTPFATYPFMGWHPLSHCIVEVIMRSIRRSGFLVAGMLALLSASALAQMTPGPRDPYTQGGATSSGTYDPYAAGARSGDKFDPYTQGAAQPTRQDLTPQQQNYQSQTYQLAPPPSQPNVVGTATDRADMRWSGPLLGSRLGPRNRFLDGA